jgi:hypothetical protein
METFDIQLKSLQLLGFYKTSSERWNKHLNHIRAFLIGLGVYFLITGSVFVALNITTDKFAVTECLGTLGTEMFTLVKLMTIWCYHNRFKNLMMDIEEMRKECWF